MDLEGATSSRSNRSGDLPKLSAELRNRADVGSLGRRRHVPDRHILDHAAAKRAQLGHRLLLSEGWASTSTSSQAGDPHKTAPLMPRERLRSIPLRFTPLGKRSSRLLKESAV